MENTQPKRPRRSRRKKPVEVVADAPTLDAAELEAEGFEKQRTRDEKGHFVADDPSTPENEAYEWVKPIEKEEPVIQAVQEPVTSKPEAKKAPKPWVKPIRPMRAKKPTTIQRGVRKRQR